MPLNKTVLATTLKDIFEDLDADVTAEDKANQIADAVDTFVRSGTVTTSVAVVSVAGVTTGPGVSGPGTGTGTGTIT